MNEVRGGLDGLRDLIGNHGFGCISSAAAAPTGGRGRHSPKLPSVLGAEEEAMDVQVGWVTFQLKINGLLLEAH